MSAVKTAAAQRRSYVAYAGAQRQAERFALRDGEDVYILKYDGGHFYVQPGGLDWLARNFNGENPSVVAVVTPYMGATITSAIGQRLTSYLRAKLS